MIITNWFAKKEQKAGDKIAKLASLSPEQVDEIQKRKEDYFNQLATRNPNDGAAEELTKSLLAASSVEIFNAYLPQIQKLYTPIKKDARENFNVNYNIRYFNITEWVIDKEENSLEKLINVYEVLADEDCNIALIFQRTCECTSVYLAVTNNKNTRDNCDANNYIERLAEALKGNFPGSVCKKPKSGIAPCFEDGIPYTVASVSNVPTEKSEKFISQTIEKLLDGIIPENKKQNYTVILLATPIQNIEDRKLRLAELYSGLAPYASWQTNFTYDESDARSSMALFGVNVGASAGIQNGQNQGRTDSQGISESESDAQSTSEGQGESVSTGTNETDSSGNTITESTNSGVNSSVTDTQNSSTSTARGTNSSHADTSGSSDTAGVSANASINISESIGVSSSTTGTIGGGFAPGSVSQQVGANFETTVGTTVGAGVNYNHGWNRGISDTVGSSLTDTSTLGESRSILEGTTTSQGRSVAEVASKAVGRSIQNTITNNTTKAITNTLGKAVSSSIAQTIGTAKNVSFGGNFGLNFARSSNVTATVGKHEGITQNFTNFNIRHALEVLEEQMKRYEQSTALGMWDFAAYVLSEDINIANNVAHSYLALTQGEKSYMSKASINMWRGDLADDRSEDAKEIYSYLRELRHPEFGLNVNIIREEPEFCVYPSLVTATTSLSGKELAYSLNFPKKSVVGFPVLECVEFGRNIITYDEAEAQTGDEAEQSQEEGFAVGNIFHMNHEENTGVSLSPNSFTSHVFVTGSTGAGKSNAVYQLLKEAKEKNKKFLVIEPAKGEYKNVFGLQDDVFVYGTNPLLMPLLRINPFSFPEEIHVLEHIDRLVEIFNVCWPMYAAMPAVLKNAVEKSYVDCGWCLDESRNPYGNDKYPCFNDVARNIKSIIDSSEYDSENKGAYKGSLLTRLKSLTNGINGMMFANDEIQPSKLFDENVIIDLSRVGSGETKSLIMGMLVLKLQEYRMTQKEMNAPLKHITVLEEAHHLLKRTSTEQSADSSNLLGKSVEMIANAIAEMRTYGEGFIIVDQAPGLLDMAAIRNTNTKIIFRLPDQLDRELVGKAANLNENQIKELARLRRGVAAIYQNEWIQPILCKIKRCEYPEGRYKGSDTRKKKDTMAYSEERFKIAELLSKGQKLGKEEILKDIQPIFEKLALDASVQVSVIKLLENPPKEIRIDRPLGPIMSGLFPEVYLAVRSSYEESSDEKDWTRSAENALYSTIENETLLQDEVRRDIVQAVITEYIYNELGKKDDLERWSENGGLR